MFELFQTEWCPGSRRVRQRLTEFGVDYIARQVPVEHALKYAFRVLSVLAACRAFDRAGLRTRFRMSLRG
jgi:hypothetical protein